MIGIFVKGSLYPFNAAWGPINSNFTEIQRKTYRIDLFVTSVGLINQSSQWNHILTRKFMRSVVAKVELKFSLP